MLKRLNGMEVASVPAASSWQIRIAGCLHLGDFLELTKPRITMLVLITTMVGFYLGSPPGPMDFWLFLHTLIGTALTASAAATLNQYLERAPDMLMRRTENRPLPAQRLDPANALLFGIALAIGGLLYFVLWVNTLAGVLALAVLGSYLFLYTPLKRKTSLCTVIGALPGATPPIIGWAGAHHGLDAKAWVLFLILFFWQFPHFLAIAWTYRDDYERAGFRMLPLQDSEGFITGRQILIFTMALIPISLLPSLLRIAGTVYLFGAIILGFLFLYYGFKVAQARTTADARRLLRASVFYLPLLLSLMVLNKL